jgi:hypothetical protein
MTEYIDLKYYTFPPLLGISLIIPNNTILFRSYNKSYDTISDRPSFYSTYENAQTYLCNKNKKLGMFLPKHNLHLLDIRYVKNILNDLILERKSNKKKIIESYLTLALSFGLIGLKEQLKLYELRYKEHLINDKRYEKIKEYIEKYEKTDFLSKDIKLNPVELNGIRIGETSNDISSSFLLKEIFGTSFDGIIFPNLESPYHYRTNNYIPCEILLFHPINQIKLLRKINSNDTIIKKNVIHLLNENHIFPIATSYNMSNNQSFYYHKGGNQNQCTDPFMYIDEKNQKIDKIDKKKIDKLRIQGESLKELLHIDYDRFNKISENNAKNLFTYEDYHPTQKISSWL